MKKIILIGRSECGKTTLAQALQGETLRYQKTQAIDHGQAIIDTPGEYAETGSLGRALALYTYEADAAALLLGAKEPFSLYPPCVTSMCNRPVVGIVTQIDEAGAYPDRAEGWLRLAGCKRVFRVSAVTGEGLADVIGWLRE